MKRLATSLAFALLISASFSSHAQAGVIGDATHHAAKTTWEHIAFIGAVGYLLIHSDVKSDENLALMTGVNGADIAREFVDGAQNSQSNFVMKTIRDRLCTLGVYAILYGLKDDFADDKPAQLFVLFDFIHRLAGNYLGK